MPDHEDLNWLRSTPSDSRNLQASIIAKTENMPQFVESKQGFVKTRKAWRRYLHAFTPIAACAVIAMVVMVGDVSDEQASSQLVSEG